MKREDVIQWMQEVGAKESNPTPQNYDGFVDIFQHFAALVAAAEREACARVAETHQYVAGWGVAAAIRARGQEVPK